MTGQEAAGALEALAARAGPEDREALEMGAAALRRKDPDALIRALGRFDFEMGQCYRRGKDRTDWDSDDVARPFCLEWARTVVCFMQAFARDPKIDIRAAAAQARAARDRSARADPGPGDRADG